MEQNAKMYIAGHKGLVGSAILNRLQKTKFSNIITRSKEFLDLHRRLLKIFLMPKDRITSSWQPPKSEGFTPIFIIRLNLFMII